MEPESSSNVDVIRRAFSAWNARDPDALELCFAPDVRIDSAFAQAEGDGAYRGLDGVRAWYRDIVETVDFVMEARQFLAYRGFVLALVVAQARGQESGVELDHQYGILYELGNGRIVRVQAYLDPADAIEAMGHATRDTRR